MGDKVDKSEWISKDNLDIFHIPHIPRSGIVLMSVNCETESTLSDKA